MEWNDAYTCLHPSREYPDRAVGDVFHVMKVDWTSISGTTEKKILEVKETINLPVAGILMELALSIDCAVEREHYN